MKSSIANENVPATSPDSDSSQPDNKLRGYLPTLDGWRCVAIILVLIYHGADAFREVSHPRISSIFTSIGHRGMWGVDLFFAISGVLITARLLEERRNTGTISLKKFYIRRACRIFPPMLTFLAVVSTLTALGVFSIGLQPILGALFFYANYLTTTSYYVGHFWSLAVEEHFYVLWPALLLLAGLSRGIKLALIVALLVAFWRAIYIYIGPYHSRNFAELGHTDVRLDEILWGCIFTMLYCHPRTRRWLDPLLTPSGKAIMGTIIFLTLLIPVRNVLTAQIFMLIRTVVLPGLLLAMIVDPSGPISRFLEFKPLRWVGRISYSLYIWQQIFFVFDGVEPKRIFPFQVWPWNLFFAFGAAIISYYLIEKPFIRLGHKLARPVTPGRSDVQT